MIDIVSIITLLGCLAAAVKRGNLSSTKWILLRLVLEMILLSSQATDAEEFLLEEGAELRLHALLYKLPTTEWVTTTPQHLPPVVEELIEEFVFFD